MAAEPIGPLTRMFYTTVRECVIRDDQFRLGVFLEANIAEQHGDHETAHRLRAHLDIRLVDQ